MMNYSNLAIPGLFQNEFQWIIEEVVVLMSGYITQPTIAISVTVILSNIYLVVLPFPVGTCNAVNMCVGKYFGMGNVYRAKRSAKIGVALAIILLIIWTVIFIFGTKNIYKQKGNCICSCIAYKRNNSYKTNKKKIHKQCFLISV